jgi:hypothetical protein
MAQGNPARNCGQGLMPGIFKPILTLSECDSSA